MKTIVKSYYDFVVNEVKMDCFIGPAEKMQLIDKYIFIYGLYADGFISGREFFKMITK